jgi:hypothetical protein
MMNNQDLSSKFSISYYLDLVHMQLSKNGSHESQMVETAPTQSFIKIKSVKVKSSNWNVAKDVGFLRNLNLPLTKYEDEKLPNIDELCSKTNFETYKQLKSVAKVQDPEISKQEIYEKLLKPFNYLKLSKYDPQQGKNRDFLY